MKTPGSFITESIELLQEVSLSVFLSRQDYDATLPWTAKAQTLAKKAKRRDFLSGFQYDFPNSMLAADFRDEIGVAESRTVNARSLSEMVTGIPQKISQKEYESAAAKSVDQVVAMRHGFEIRGYLLKGWFYWMFGSAEPYSYWKAKPPADQIHSAPRWT